MKGFQRFECDLTKTEKECGSTKNGKKQTLLDDQNLDRVDLGENLDDERLKREAEDEENGAENAEGGNPFRYRPFRRRCPFFADVAVQLALDVFIVVHHHHTRYHN